MASSSPRGEFVGAQAGSRVCAFGAGAVILAVGLGRVFFALKR